MRMYVILAIAALLVFGLLFQLVRTSRAEKKRERKHAEAAARLEAVAVQAAREHAERTAIVESSAELTAVIPAIKLDSQAPRKVA